MEEREVKDWLDWRIDIFKESERAKYLEPDVYAFTDGAIGNRIMVRGLQKIADAICAEVTTSETTIKGQIRKEMMYKDFKFFELEEISNG